MENEFLGGGFARKHESHRKWAVDIQMLYDYEMPSARAEPE
jgi:hypothetical protein